MTLIEEIESLRTRRAYYERLGKRLTVRAIDMRLAPLVEKQLRKENRQDRRAAKVIDIDDCKEVYHDAI